MNWDYIAGFMDGEGCISISVRGRNRQTYMKVTFTNTDQNVLREIQILTNGSLSCFQSKNPINRDRYNLTVVGVEARDTLRNVLPMLITKKRQAELALEFCEWRDSVKHTTRANSPLATEGLVWKNKMHVLNRKGRVI